MTRKITLDETLRQKIPKELGITYVPKLKLVFDTNLPSRISLRTLKGTKDHFLKYVGVGNIIIRKLY
jgi:hypothetical protein